MESLRSVFFKIDRSTKKLTTGRIHYFDIRYLSAGGGFIIPCSILTVRRRRIRFFRVSFSIKLAAFQARGGAYMKLHEIQCHSHEEKYPCRVGIAHLYC